MENAMKRNPNESLYAWTRRLARYCVGLEEGDLFDVISNASKESYNCGFDYAMQIESINAKQRKDIMNCKNCKHYSPLCYEGGAVYHFCDIVDGWLTPCSGGECSNKHLLDNGKYKKV